MKRSNYIVVLKCESQVLIRDLGPWENYLSVTNDVENVVKELLIHGTIKPGMRLLYIDSYNEILFDGNGFLGFKFCSEEFNETS